MWHDGRAWHKVPLPVPRGRSLCWGFPATAFDADGRLYVCMPTKRAEASGHSYEVSVFCSGDNGRTFDLLDISGELRGPNHWFNIERPVGFNRVPAPRVLWTQYPSTGTMPAKVFLVEVQPQGARKVEVPATE